MKQPIKIILGSNNQHCRAALKVALDCVGISPEIEVRPVTAGGPLQPTTLDAIFAGAEASVAQCWNPHRGDTTWVVGMKMGTVQVRREVYLLQTGIVVRGGEDQGLTVFASSAGMQVPSDCVREAQRMGLHQHTVGDVLAYRCHGDAEDPQGILTDGTLGRTDSMLAGLIGALKQMLLA